MRRSNVDDGSLDCSSINPRAVFRGWKKTRELFRLLQVLRKLWIARDALKKGQFGVLPHAYSYQPRLSSRDFHVMNGLGGTDRRRFVVRLSVTEEKNKWIKVPRISWIAQKNSRSLN
jgi:hypothetical protein